jgi:hypothetical protein
MQTYDKKNYVKSAQTGPADELSRKAAIELESPDTDRVVIGKLPTYKQVIVINGLAYRVKFINRRAGEVTLKLIGRIQPHNNQTVAENSVSEIAAASLE